ncbi:hypothetical protein [Leptolyngbya sp. Heron Island J]|uniref:hypothetical protein n=1 Tax=Leptolyngbya sp. Heron Island J TaxID=1385935 RepID=UPI0003FB2D46|nr:hypothetical protein [Leptolyngbya sp. Heron Island J]
MMLIVSSRLTITVDLNRQTTLSSQSMQWSQCEKAFEFDGSWRDIYILNTSSMDWDKLLDALSHSKYEIKFWVDNAKSQPILTMQEALEIRKKACPLMHVEMMGIAIACHFFTDENIEFDIDPRQVVNQQDLDAILDFMTFLGNLLQKTVVLTPENLEDIPLIQFFPKAQTFSYHKENERYHQTPP